MLWATRGIYCRTKRGTRGPRTGRRVGAVLVRDWRCLESLFLPFSSNRASSLPVSGFQNLLILSVCAQSFSPRNAPRAGQRSLVVEAVEAECLGSCLGPVPARPPGFGHTVLCSRALIRNELVHASRSPSFRVPTTSALGASKREVWSSPALPGVVCAGHLLTQDRPLLLRPAGLSGAASGEPPCLAGPRFSAVGEEIEPDHFHRSLCSDVSGALTFGVVRPLLRPSICQLPWQPAHQPCPRAWTGIVCMFAFLVLVL